MKFVSKNKRIQIDIKLGDQVKLKNHRGIWFVVRLPRKNGTCLDTQCVHFSRKKDKDGELLVSPYYIAEYIKELICS